MSEFMFGFAQMVAVFVIVGGVMVAVWQVWVLAYKLARQREREIAAAAAAETNSLDRRANTNGGRYR